QAAWLRADRAAALSCLGRAVALFDTLPDSPAKAEAYAELGRLHMLNYERDEAVAAARAAAEIASRLGLVEVQANARITVGTALYQSGDPRGLDELHAVVDLCRGKQLLALTRASQNLAYALREEGDYDDAEALLADARPPGGGHTLATGYSHEAMRAYFAGDFERQLQAADAFVDTPGGRWDMQVRGLRNCLRVLRDKPVPSSGDTDDVAEALASARGGGFHRPLWTALALGALCRVLQGRRDEAKALLAELAEAV